MSNVSSCQFFVMLIVLGPGKYFVYKREIRFVSTHIMTCLLECNNCNLIYRIMFRCVMFVFAKNNTFLCCGCVIVFLAKSDHIRQRHNSKT